MVQYSSVAADPFSILTVVVAPAVLTNASSVLALGTNNRLARVADRGHALTAQLESLSRAPGIVRPRSPSSPRCKRVLNCCYERFAAFTWVSGCSPVRLLSRSQVYRGVLWLAIGIPDSGWNWRRVRNISGHRVGLRVRHDDSRNAACSQRFSLRC